MYRKSDNLPEIFLSDSSSSAAVSRIDFADLETARQTLAACQAFDDPSDDTRLRMPPEMV